VGAVRNLQDLVTSLVESGQVPGVVALVARGDDVEVAAAGSTDLEGTAPVTPDSIFRIASITKPVTAAAVMVLVDEGRLELGDPIARWLPELAAPVVVRTPEAPVDDVVPAARPITVEDLLTFRAGWGFPSDFDLPAVQPLFSELRQGPPSDAAPAPDAWLAALARIPLLAQPGETWLYNTCSDVLGVLVERVAGAPFPDVLAERVLEPLGMADTGFWVPAAALGRFTTAYRPGADGELVVADRPDGMWSRPPAFASGAGGLVSTAGDWYRFGRMLLAGGLAGGRRLLSEQAVRLMTTDHLTEAQRADSSLFLEGQGWGFGGSVDVAPRDDDEVWVVPGRYGWVGGSGTSAHVVPTTGTVAVLLTQREMTGPSSTPALHAFWRYAAGAPVADDHVAVRH
jgi:CubicO group peptidase (beta-lactamase class C family)